MEFVLFANIFLRNVALFYRDMSWGPPPDLFRYEVQEIDSESGSQEMHVLEAIDVKREKTCLTRDKCRSLIKLHTYYNEVDRAWRVQVNILSF